MKVLSEEPEGEILDSGILAQLEDVELKRFSPDHLIAIFAVGMLFTTLTFVLVSRASRRWRTPEIEHTLLSNTDDLDDLEVE